MNVSLREPTLPNRIIRESCRTSATLYRLSHGAERMFWRLTTVADDFGRFEASEQILKSQCFPLWPDSRLKLAQVRAWMAEMVAADLVKVYIVDGKTYGFFVTWDRHQERRAKRSKYPDPTSANICEQMRANVPEDRGSRIEDRGSRIGNTSPVEQESADAVAWGKPEHLVELYNAVTPDDHPKVKHLSPERRKKAARYLASFPERSFWVRAFTEVKYSAFLRYGGKERTAFRGDFDWLLTRGKDGSENVVKTAEGKYRGGVGDD